MNHKSSSVSLSFQRATVGSRWFYGNFILGLHVNSHPRWTEFVVSLVFWHVILRVDAAPEPESVNQ